MGEHEQGQAGQPGQQQDQHDAVNQDFASAAPERQREFASQGGQSLPDEKRSFSQDREPASEAARRGDEAGGQDAQPDTGRPEGGERAAPGDSGAGETIRTSGLPLEGGPGNAGA